MSGPMDPERLAEARLADHSTFGEYYDDLLGDRDDMERRLAGVVRDRDSAADALRRHRDEVKRLNAALVESEAEVQRYRSRCPVEASDVEAAGVTHVGCWEWFKARGFSQSGPTDDCGFHHLIGNWGPVIAHGYVHTSWTSEDIARLVNATSWRAPASVVLDEMAAMDTGAEVDQ